MIDQLRKILGFYGRFLLSFSRIGFFFRRLVWSTPPIDFSGQTWLVTGASGGIGRAIALAAAGQGARVIAIARNRAKLEQLQTQGTPEIEVADLALQSQVRELAARLAARGERIDVLVNNVGVLLDDFTVTAEGFETSYATNLLNHYLLTERLIGEGLIGDGGLVINMSSAGMYNVPLLVEPMKMSADNYNGVLAYGLHKRAQLVLTAWWQKKYVARGMRFHVMHPGWADTDGVKTALPRFRRLLRPLLRNAEQAADTAIWLATLRPAARDDVIWFDRKPRPAHVYAHTRASPDSATELVALLEEDLHDG